MRRFFQALALLIAAGGVAPALANLQPGSAAPEFQTKATLGGKVFDFDLSAALKKGPVVLYFYPAAFTKDCTLEARDFADHVGQYKRLGATVIGISGDDIEKLNKFSVSECRNRFAVASDADLAISKKYDAVLNFAIKKYADRVSYVIAPSGTIVYAYKSLDPGKHVANTLAALRKTRSGARRR